jgi:hypothetical protein
VKSGKQEKDTRSKTREEQNAETFKVSEPLIYLTFSDLLSVATRLFTLIVFVDKEIPHPVSTLFEKKPSHMYINIR